ncbi:MAG: hypothetical protein A3C53_05500 [Omnitrophica WOR_2 bacterium RIFCSPHIGHO2_02_FULL_68_15]|nr:MAG: hypothetical protein A3C53_05500 [Omnitrophica WOR_2 bacterium RIFCSPHIGHO2_02_FULL_68_15]
MVEKRPWGGYRVLLREPGLQVKRIHLEPGRRFSLQRHRRRIERWIIMTGTGIVTIGARRRRVRPGSFVEVPRLAAHRLHNTGKRDLVLVEVQFGDYLKEDDVIRLEDDYGRV